MRKSLLLTTSLAVLLNAGNSFALNLSNQTIQNVNNLGDYGARYVGRDDRSGFVAENSKFLNNSGEYGGGALALFAGHTANVTNIITNSEFSENKTTGKIANDGYNNHNLQSSIDGGGAIFLGSASQTIIENSSFVLNTSTVTGGAISTRADWRDKNGTILNNNYKKPADYDSKEDILYKNTTASVAISGSKFIKNTSETMGGAFYNTFSDATIDSSSFSNNEAKKGGAIYNEMASELVIKASDIKASEFKNNKASVYGGAIENTGKLTLLGTEDKHILFSENWASQGSAIANGIRQKSGELTASYVDFEGNEALYQGALTNFHKADVSNAKFDGNKITAKLVDDGFNNHNIDTSVDGGAAIFAGSASETKVKDSVFTNNTSTSDGGAIATRADWANPNGKPDGSANDYVKENKEAILSVSNSSFDGNKADLKGGGLYNTFRQTSLENVTFSGNTAADRGGAIYNESLATIAFDGNNVFSGNSALNGGNDIWNDGILNFNSGTSSFDGGISGSGTINVKGGATLDIGTSTVEAKNFAFDSGSTLALQVNGNANGEYGKVVVAEGGNFSNAGANLSATLGQGVWSDGFNVKLIEGIKDGEDQFGYTFSNNMYEFTGLGDGSYTVSKIANASDLVNGESSGVASAWTDGNAFTDGTQKEVADRLAALAQTNPGAYEEALKAVTPGKHNIVQGATTDHTNQVIGAVESRLSGGCSFFCTGAEGKASGDNVFNTAMSWIQGLFNKSKLSRDDGFDAKSAGIAFGFEDYINDNSKAGIGYAFTNTDVDSVDGRNTDIDTHTVFVYGEYKPSKWFVNGYAGYNFADYEESSVLKKADYDVNSISLQAMTGYELSVGSFDVIPQAGVRYINIDKDSHTDSLDQKISGDKSDIFTGVAGVKVAKDFFTEGGNYIRPEVKLAATYDFHNDGANSVVSLSNGSSYTLQGRALERFGIETGAGVSVEASDRVEISAAYEGKFRQDYEDHTGLLNFKYKF